MAETVTVTARLRARPGREARLREELAQLLGPTRAEPGCIAYDLLQDCDDAGSYLFYEVWESRADLDAHLQQPHLKDFLGKSEELLAEPLGVAVWKAVDTGT